MSRTLYHYYERELTFIRQLSQEFAKQYPAAAGRLRLEANRSTDPHVERMIEAFALLTGRIQHKLDDEFPELTDALLGVLYPHYLAPLPSMAIVQFMLDPARAQLPKGFLIDRRSRLRTAADRRHAMQVPHGLPGDPMARPGVSGEVHTARPTLPASGLPVVRSPHCVFSSSAWGG